MWDLIVSVPDHCLSFCFVLVDRSTGPGPMFVMLIPFSDKAAYFTINPR